MLAILRLKKIKKKPHQKNNSSIYFDNNQFDPCYFQLGVNLVLTTYR